MKNGFFIVLIVILAALFLFIRAKPKAAAASKTEPADTVEVPDDVIYEKGDVNGDGKVDSQDIDDVTRIILGATVNAAGKKYTADQIARADVTLNGEIDMGDVIRLEKIMLGLD